MGGTVVDWVKLGALRAASLTTTSLLAAPNGLGHAWNGSVWLALLVPHPLQGFRTV
jgi:hypothetical protein